MSLKGKVLIKGQTDVGSVRDHNEDAISSDENTWAVIVAGKWPAPLLLALF